MIKSKKSVHINLKYDTHKGFKIECFKRNLSMQEVFEEFAQKVAAESPDVISIMEMLSEKKRNRIIEKLSETDAESLYNIIEKENPLG